MLGEFGIGVTLPAADLERARAWYEQKLGLIPMHEWAGGLRYRSGSSFFDIYPTSLAGTAKNTAAGWDVDDVARVVEELRSRGVVFEEYDFPGLKTVNGIAEMDGERAAWFIDSEGNILSISQLTDA
jgi:catechol 2,3-dioxygenase-like lactoylglutathione lyase family enzyme